MQITCPGCHFSREIPEGKTPPNATLATCPKCKLRFKFRDAPATRTTTPASSETEGQELGRRGDRPMAAPRVHGEAEPAATAVARVQDAPAASPAPDNDVPDEIQPLRETLASTNALPELHARMGEDVLDYAIAEERARSAPPRPLSSRKPVSPEDADALMGGPPVEPIAPPAAYAKELAEAGLTDQPEAEAGERPQPMFEELSRSYSADQPRDDLLAAAPKRPSLAADRLISAFEESADGHRRHPLADTFLPPEKGRERAPRAEAKPKAGFFGRRLRSSPDAEADADSTGRMSIPGLRASAAELLTHHQAPQPDLTDSAEDVDRKARQRGSEEAEAPSSGLGSKGNGRGGKNEGGRTLAGLFRRPPTKPQAPEAATEDKELAIPGLHCAPTKTGHDEAMTIPGLRGVASGIDAGEAFDAPLSIPGLRRSAVGSQAAFGALEGDMTIPGLGRPVGRSSSRQEEDDGTLAIPGLRYASGAEAASGDLEIPGLRRAGPGLADELDGSEAYADDRSRQAPAGNGGLFDRLLGRGDSRVQSGDIWQDLEDLGDEGENSSATDAVSHAEPAPWEDPRRGLIGGFLGTAAGAMFAPARFFGRLTLDGGLGRPVLFVAALAEILALVHFLLDSMGVSTSALLGAGPFFDFGLGGLGAGGLLAFATYPLIAVAALALLAMYRFGMLALVGSSEGGFSGAVRVLAYGAAPFLLLAAPVLGLPLALPWFMAITVVGFRAANRTSYARVAVACVLPDFLAVFLFLYAALSAGVIP